VNHHSNITGGSVYGGRPSLPVNRKFIKVEEIIQIYGLNKIIGKISIGSLNLLSRYLAVDNRIAPTANVHAGEK
jgi:hypothetical protein